MEPKITFSLHQVGEVAKLTFELSGAITPEDLKGIEDSLPLLWGKGVVLSGRGPIWLFGALQHFYHTARWVALHDPRLGGAVVTASHQPGITIGDVVKFPEELFRE